MAGSYDQARQALEKCLAFAERYRQRFFIGWTHQLIGEIELMRNPAEAASHFEKSIEVLRGIKAESILPLAYAGYGRCQKEQGNMALAREYMSKALEILERLGTLGEPDKIRRELAELPET